MFDCLGGKFYMSISFISTIYNFGGYINPIFLVGGQRSVLSKLCYVRVPS